MPKSLMVDKEFIDAWNRALGSATEAAKLLGRPLRSVLRKREALAKKGIVLQTNPGINPEASKGASRHGWTIAYQPWERSRKFEIKNGTVVMFSDPHWLPDHSAVGMDTLTAVVRELNPTLVVCGGDALDGSTISRWDPTRGHHKRFNIREELECVKESFDHVQAAAGRKAMLAWVLGNHDARLSRWVAVNAELLLDMPYTRLEEWVPNWPLSWTVAINEGTPGHTVIRHRNKAGMLHLQGIKAGCHYAHGHRHQLNVHMAPTFTGYRFSVDAGSLADCESEGFDYMEGDTPHVQGFAVLTYKDYQLMPPELCVIQNGEGWFRGQRV